MANTATSIYTSTNNAYIESSETFTFTGDFTVEFWFYGESYENANYTFLYELGDHTTSSSPFGGVKVAVYNALPLIILTFDAKPLNGYPPVSALLD